MDILQENNYIFGLKNVLIFSKKFCSNNFRKRNNRNQIYHVYPSSRLKPQALEVGDQNLKQKYLLHFIMLIQKMQTIHGHLVFVYHFLMMHYGYNVENHPMQKVVFMSIYDEEFHHHLLYLYGKWFSNR